VSSLATHQERAETGGDSLRAFLDETALSGRDDLKKDEERPAAITLMTLHSAKGLEFGHVYLVGLEEGLLPHRRAVMDAGGSGIAEERRLGYVGVTRAKDYLTLSCCKARMKWGVERPQIPSRFLMEMRGETEKAARAAEAAATLFASEGRGPGRGGGRPAPAPSDGARSKTGTATRKAKPTTKAAAPKTTKRTTPRGEAGRRGTATRN
jgi:DNA helicase-2/ATP-dependent DNA helicase PcrA